MYIRLRATFGGTPYPYDWSVISETITDLSNLILNFPDWDHETLNSPFQDRVPKDVCLPDNTPLAQASPTVVTPHADYSTKVDVYIDDTTTINIKDKTHQNSAIAVVLLATNTLGRPLPQIKTIPRKKLVSNSKLSTE